MTDECHNSIVLLRDHSEMYACFVQFVQALAAASVMLYYFIGLYSNYTFVSKIISKTLNLSPCMMLPVRGHHDIAITRWSSGASVFCGCDVFCLISG